MPWKQPTRTIAVVTGSRAEFGLLQPVMRAVALHRRLRLRTIVAGAHLVAGTWRDVREAGVAITQRVPMQQRGGTGRAADVRALSRGIAKFGEAFTRINPTVVLVLGDRIEPFAAACAAQVGGWRLAHIHGGDRAEGIADEAMRHAISKLAHLHFAATAQSRRRLIRMGEPADHVFNVGSPAADDLRHVQPAADAPELIIMQHPIGDSDAIERRRMAATLRATRGHVRLIMLPNTDPGRDGIVAAIEAERCVVCEHLRREHWLAMLGGAKALVGNSSAGLIEASILRVACVNVGPRQAGREKPANVIDCDYGQASVHRAVARGLRIDLRRLRHPYGDGRASQRIADLLADYPLENIPLRKQNAY